LKIGKTGCPEDGLVSVEDMSAFQARKVYEATGLSCIASRTSFEIEPVPPSFSSNQKFLKDKVDQAMKSYGGASTSVKLRDRVLKNGNVLFNDIIDVSTFVDSQVDVNLMDDCARFDEEKVAE
jgi:hypothetical protein